MARRNIVTFDKYRKPINDCRDEGYRDDSDAVFLLAQNLTALNARFAFVESEQTITNNDVVARLDQIIDLLLAGGVIVPPLPAPSITNTDETSTLDETQVDGAPAALAEPDALFAQIDAALAVSEDQLADLDGRIAALEN